MSPCHLVAVLYAFIHENSYQSTYLLIKSIHYEKESIFFDDDARARLYGRGACAGSVVV